MKLRGTFLALAGMAVLGLGLQSASAASITYSGSGLVAGDNVTAAAQAVLTQAAIGAPVTITLTNLTAAVDTKSAKELLTGLVLNPTPTGYPVGYSLASQGATHTQEFTFSTNTVGAVSNGTFASDWALDASPNGIYFDGHSHGPVIIGGPAAGGTTYANANSSVGNESPAIYQTATFIMNVPGAFDISGVTSVNFLFNTDGGISIPSTPHFGDTQPVPLPAAVWSGGALIVGLAAVRRMKRKAA